MGAEQSQQHVLVHQASSVCSVDEPASPFVPYAAHAFGAGDDHHAEPQAAALADSKNFISRPKLRDSKHNTLVVVNEAGNASQEKSSDDFMSRLNAIPSFQPLLPESVKSAKLSGIPTTLDNSALANLMHTMQITWHKHALNTSNAQKPIIASVVDAEQKLKHLTDNFERRQSLLGNLACDAASALEEISRGLVQCEKLIGQAERLAIELNKELPSDLRLEELKVFDEKSTNKKT